MKVVRDFLEVSALKWPEKTALVCDGERHTYRALNERASSLGAGFARLGVEKGDRVVFHLPNSVELVVGIFAAAKIGAGFVVVNHTVKKDKLVYILNNCRARVLVASTVEAVSGEAGAGSPGGLPHLERVVALKTGEGDGDGPFSLLGFDDLVHGSTAEAPARNVLETDLACLIYTSGTTGDPKGVVSDHGNMVFAAQSIITYLGQNESDVIMNVLPLSFDYGLYQVMMAFCCGATLVLEKSFTFPAAILKKIESERVTGFPGVPTIFAMLVKMDLSSFDLSSLRFVTNTAAALPPEHIRQIRMKFPGVIVHSMYGLTETKRTLYLPPEELDRRPDSVGIPIPGTEAWIEDERGNRMEPGAVGELVARGRHVMRGYWEAPEATAERFRHVSDLSQCVCHTGDLFRQDSDGFFYFVARQDDIIKSRGEKVAPKEVESVLYRLAGILEAAVVGEPDPVLGQAIKALVVKSDASLTEKQVLAHCRRHLEDYMVPKIIEFREELPKTTSGKIQRSALS